MNSLAKLRRLDAQFADAETRYLRMKAGLIAAEIELERQKQKLEADRELRQAEMDKQVTAIQKYYANERERELAREDQKRKDTARRILDEINRDVCRTERETLRRRGVLR